MMKKILVPVDFSRHTDFSSRFALQIARKTGSEIILFHSFFDQFYYSDGGMTTGFESGIMMTDEIILDFYKQKEQLLINLKNYLQALNAEKDSMPVNITCQMESGNPEVQIICAIEKHIPDLIILGSGGMGRKGLMAGSVTRRIIDLTTIPVIAVPDISEIEGIRNVAYMTSFSTEDPAVISAIDELLEEFRIDIFCLHLSKDEKDPEAMQRMQELSASKALEHLKERMSYYIVKQDHDKEILQNFMVTHQIGLIAFIPHHRNVFENLFYQGITKEELFRTRIPLLALKPGQQ